MKKSISICILFCISFFAFAQKITILDKTTKESIAFVTISLGNENGFYSNKNGRFNLEDVNVETITLSSLGFKTQKITVNEILNNEIFLEPEDVQLEEIVISTKKKKYKVRKTKPIKHNDFLNAYMNIIGGEIACFIPNKYNNKDVFLNSISIPIVTKTISFDSKLIGKKQIVKKLDFSALYKVSFYKNENGIPGKELIDETITLIFNQKSTVIKINLEIYGIYLPKEGFFVGLLNLGPTNKNGNLIPTSPYVEKMTKNGMMRFSKPVKPYFPVIIKINKANTYSRFSFKDYKEWKKFHVLKKGNTFQNISLGYELKIYDE